MTATERPLSTRDQADLDSISVAEQGEPAVERSVLEVWDHVLGNVAKSRAKPITLGVAQNVVASWPFLSFQDTARYHEVYHDILLDAHEVLKEVLTEHPEYKGWVGEQDGEENHALYVETLVGWQNLLDQRETDWSPAHVDAHILPAAVADARAFFFSAMGFAGHLDAIGFSLTDDEFLNALTASREV